MGVVRQRATALGGGWVEFSSRTDRVGRADLDLRRLQPVLAAATTISGRISKARSDNVRGGCNKSFWRFAVCRWWSSQTHQSVLCHTLTFMIMPGAPRSTLHHAGPCCRPSMFVLPGPASVCEQELCDQSLSVFLSTTRSGSPPQPTVLEAVAPQRRTPLIPLTPPPPTFGVVTAHVFNATHGSNSQLPYGTFASRLR